MRQREDLAYAEIMGRMRVQALTDDDVTSLKSRLIPISNVANPFQDAVDYYIQLKNTDSRAVAVFPTNDEVNKFNVEVTNSLGLEVVVVQAEDTRSRKPRENVHERPYQRKEYDIRGPQVATSNHGKDDLSIARAAGLDATLKLGVRGRVMLRRNLDRRLGLVNGATGVLEEIVREGDRISVLKVFFKYC